MKEDAPQGLHFVPSLIASLGNGLNVVKGLEQ
jgi:hypothetical protein